MQQLLQLWQLLLPPQLVCFLLDSPFPVSTLSSLQLCRVPRQTCQQDYHLSLVYQDSIRVYLANNCLENIHSILGSSIETDFLEVSHFTLEPNEWTIFRSVIGQF